MHGFGRRAPRPRERRTAPPVPALAAARPLPDVRPCSASSNDSRKRRSDPAESQSADAQQTDEPSEAPAVEAPPAADVPQAPAQPAAPAVVMTVTPTNDGRDEVVETVEIVPPPLQDATAKKSWLARLKTGPPRRAEHHRRVRQHEDRRGSVRGAETALLMSDAGVDATEYLLGALRERCARAA